MISPLASIHPDAKVAGNVRVDAFAVVEHDTVLGEGTWIMSGGHVLAGSRLGKNCRIHQGAVVGGLPQDLKFSGEYSEVFLGDGCIVREGATINRGTKAYGKTKTIHERHRHRYELNNKFRERLSEAGLRMSGVNPDLDLVEMIELPGHPWFVGTQFHPEYSSTVDCPHPLFVSFVQAALQNHSQRVH